MHYKNSSGDEIANVNFYAVRPGKLPEFAAITQNNGYVGTNRKLITQLLSSTVSDIYSRR